MSAVTSVIILCSTLEESPDDVWPALHYVNEWLRAENYGELKRLDPHARGRKAMQADVYGGAFNHLDEEGFMARLTAAPWDAPDCVQILLKREEDWTFTLYDLDAARAAASPSTEE